MARPQMTSDQARLAAARLRALREEQERREAAAVAAVVVRQDEEAEALVDEIWQQIGEQHQAEKAAAAVTLGEPLEDPVESLRKVAEAQPWHAEAPTHED